MENLEKFVIRNREAFDQEVPSLKVWAEIDKQVEHKNTQKQSFGSFYRMAAAITLLLTAGAAFGWYNNQGPSPQMEIATIAPEFAEMDAYYSMQVSQKQKALAKTPNNDPALQEDLSQMDEVMQELKNDLLNAPKGSREMIINAMIINYQAKIDILERVLEQSKSTFKEDETNMFEKGI